MTDLIILAGTRDAIPEDLLSAHIRHTPGVARLLIVNEGGLAASNADQSRDLVIDPDRGNWDVGSDCRDEAECMCVAEAILEPAPPPLLQVATLPLTEILLDVLEQPRSDVGHLLAAIRSIPLASIELPPGSSDPEQRMSRNVLAMQHTAAGSFPPRDQRMPLTSFGRWYDNPAGRILYLSSPPAHVIAVAVRRAILALARGLTLIEPNHALIRFESASERGG